MTLALRRLGALPICLLLAGAAACGDGGGRPSGRARMDSLDESTARWAARASYAGFGIELFRQIAYTRPGTNAFVSPASAGLALALPYHGASDGTRDQLARALGFGSAAPDTVARANGALRAALDRSGPVRLEVATSLWAAAHARLAPAFLERGREDYGAEVDAVDFGDPSGERRIYEWVGEATHGRIPGLSFPPDPETLLLVLNAVWFKGAWAEKFDPAATRPRPFRREDGRTVRAPMMSRTGEYGYLDAAGFRAVRLPYAGGRFALYVFLPDSGATLESFIGALSAAEWEAHLRNFPPAPVALTLPRFAWRGALDLAPALQAMGVRDAFDHTRADFHEMFAPQSLAGRPNPFIGRVHQQAFVEVNEEGTEAAAATGVGVDADTAGAPPPPVPFVADRPFLFAVRDDRTGALLFLGQMHDPTLTADPTETPEP